MSKVEHEIRNIDGEIIDFTKDDLAEKLTYESANFIRRMIAFLIDLVFIVVIWYLCTKHQFKQVDEFIENLGLNEADFTDAEKLKQFADSVGQLYLKLFLTFIFVQTLYFTLIPAIIGNGQSIGKLVAGIGVVDLETLEEISPIRLVFREFIGRGLVETVLIIPLIISFFIAFFRDDSRSLHDLMAKTVVVKLDLYDID
ncbi:MAG TPA: RDD family protein [Bacilli bacterium]|nr:RDD family protein [Bacilli bacterium]HRU49379.1 RDD family protein [Bacilli bacterium]